MNPATESVSESTVSPAAPKQLPNVQNLGRLILGPLDFALAAGCRKALELGVPAHEAVELLLNHLASVVAMIEPPGARERTLEGLVSAFGPMVRKHVEARFTTAGGIKLPQVGDVLNG